MTSNLPEEQKGKIHELKELKLRDKIIDIPGILSKKIRKTIYDTFSQLSIQCGPRSSLHYYSEIKCSKFRVAFEDGIGISTIYILMALIENQKQINHYKQKIKHSLLNDNFFKQKMKSIFYIDCRFTEEKY